MNLTSAQLTTLKQWVIANRSGLFDDATVAVLNAVASPSYLVWKTSIARTDLYDKPSATGSFWDWALFKGQAVAEQNTWREMFMGDVGRIDLVNWRGGVAKIFTGTQAMTTQRDHVFACGRRSATVAQKLFAVAVSNPPANTGNDVVQARGSAANPDNFGTGSDSLPLDGQVNLQNLIDADSHG